MNKINDINRTCKVLTGRIVENANVSSPSSHTIAVPTDASRKKRRLHVIPGELSYIVSV